MEIIKLTTDGSCNPMTRIGGWAAILEGAQGKRVELSGRVLDSTNNLMELTALLEGITALETPSCVTVVTDSQLVIGWLEGGWKRREPGVRALLERIEAKVSAGKHRLNFHWVKGHAGHADNVRCDHLARAARDAQGHRARTTEINPEGAPLH